MPLTDLVADTERLLLLDAETAARPGPVGRAHLDAFADVVADFTAGAEVSTLPALLDYLDTAERAEEGFAPGEVEVARTVCRSSPCTPRRASSGRSSRCRTSSARCSRAARSAGAG